MVPPAVARSRIREERYNHVKKLVTSSTSRYDGHQLALGGLLKLRLPESDGAFEKIVDEGRVIGCPEYPRAIRQAKDRSSGCEIIDSSPVCSQRHSVRRRLMSCSRISFYATGFPLALPLIYLCFHTCPGSGRKQEGETNSSSMIDFLLRRLLATEKNATLPFSEPPDLITVTKERFGNKSTARALLRLLTMRCIQVP